MQEKRKLRMFIPTQLHSRKSLIKAYEDVMEKEKQIQELRKKNNCSCFYTRNMF